MVIDAIVQNKALGVVADLRLKKLGKLSKETIEKQIGEDLDVITKRINEIREGYIKLAREEQGDDAINKKFKQLWLSDKEIIDLGKEESDLWNTDFEFEFEPPVIRLTGSESDKFSDESTKVAYGYIEKEIFAYTAFLGLVDEGYIVIEE